MSWKSFAREIERSAKRAHRRAVVAERAEAQRQRALEKQWRAQQKAQQVADERAYAAWEVSRYESYLEMLVSVHKECGAQWDWQAIYSSQQPTPPERYNAWEAHARGKLNAYVPGFFDKLFGGTAKKIAQFEAGVVTGRQQDEARYQHDYNAWQQACATRNYERSLAARVLAGDPAVYEEVLGYVGAFDEVTDYGTVVTSSAARADVVMVTAEIRDPELVPSEILKLTSTGKLSSKNMPKGQYWELYQDHVCSCAIRLAREVFAALPVQRAAVNIGTREVNPATGHKEVSTQLAVHFTRGGLAKINLDRIDPSDSMANFDSRMKFAKTKGFTPVEAITVDEQFISA